MLKLPLKSFAPARKMLALLTERSQHTAPAALALPRPTPPIPTPARNLMIPIRSETPDAEACRTAQQRGQFLARQERWRDLSDEIRAADAARQCTPGGMPISELLAFGARSDVVNGVEQALQDGCPIDSPVLSNGVSALEDMRQEHPRDPYLTLIVALTHIDVAWAWRGTGWDTAVPDRNRKRVVAHFDRASILLAPFCGIELDSPAIASARCALLAGQRDPDTRIADDYEDLIDLDPRNARHMRALGYHLLPRWFGNYRALDLEARRTASRTHDLWGNGGYTWVCFDAIAIDDNACAMVDVDFFIDGLRDIVARRPDQETVNLLAAYCAVAMRRTQGHSAEADFTRMQIVNCAEWLIRDHLTEVHPLIWAHAADGFDNNARVTSIAQFQARGKDQALCAIADLFRDEIASGHSVTFTPNGPELHMT